MNYSYYSITTNGTISGIMQYIDASTYFIFAPAIILLVFAVIFFANKSNIKHGFVYASLVSIITALLLKSILPYFNEMYILATIGLLLISLLILIFA